MDQQNPSTRAFTSDRSPATAAVDNLLRRALKISDPRNPDEVAKGLLARYTDEATKIRRERQGLPFSVMHAQQVAAPVPVNGAVRPEVRAAQDALDAALNALTTDADLVDIAPELRGWSSTIQRAASDGLSSARYGIDPGERDRAFGARRILGEYARLARYASAVSSCAQNVYCHLARACDDVANIVLVMIGDALGDAGITRSGAVLQVPAAILQSRRDGVITALRNMLQPSQSDGEESWPRGPLAVYQIYGDLDAAGAPDLRALLDEAYLSQQLDDLVDMCTGSSPDGLRAATSAAAITVQRLQRFLTIAQSLITPPSPPAAMFFMELQLFMQGFAGLGTGYRLPYLARSPLLVSNFAASAGVDDPTGRLLRIALNRSAFADAVDCLCCSCNQDDSRDLVVAGKLLFDIDRAIDLYALGTDTNGLGDTEWRACAYGAVVAQLPLRFLATTASSVQVPQILDNIRGDLRWPDIIRGDVVGDERSNRSRQLAEIINIQISDERRWSDLVRSIAPLCRQNLLFRGPIVQPTPGNLPPLPNNPIGDLLQNAANAIVAAAQHAGWDQIADQFVISSGDAPRPQLVPAPIATSLSRIADDNP
jgi:hypothetical protein